MQKFSLVALPDKTNLKILNKLKLFFNKSGFRGKVKNTTTDAHITLAKGEYTHEVEINRLKDVILESLNVKYSPFKVFVSRIAKDKKGPNSKRDHEYYWIALNFEDKRLEELFKTLDGILSKLNISLTKNYVDMVHALDSASAKSSIVGDHMNICNYCLPEHVEAAYKKTLDKAPSHFLISKIALRHKSGKHAWEISL